MDTIFTYDPSEGIKRSTQPDESLQNSVSAVSTVVTQWSAVHKPRERAEGNNHSYESKASGFGNSILVMSNYTGASSFRDNQEGEPELVGVDLLAIMRTKVQTQARELRRRISAALFKLEQSANVERWSSFQKSYLQIRCNFEKQWKSSDLIADEVNKVLVTLHCERRC